MRVLMLSDVYFPRINGVSTAIQTYRTQLARLGIASSLIAPSYDHETDEGEDDASSTIRLPGWTVPFDREDRIVSPRHFREVAGSMARNADVIHIHTPFAAHMAGVSAARRNGIPVVASYHTLFEEYLHHYARFVPRALTRTLARRISRHQCEQLDAVIVPSSPMAERLKDYGVSRPLHILPTGIPLERFRSGDRSRFRMHYQIEEDRFVALYVGRAAHEKNIGFLIEAFKQALNNQPHMLLMIAGEGPALAHLRNHVQAAHLTDSVRFIGYLDRDSELPDCYAAADAFVFASKTETQGLVLLEAMAAGLPVIALAEMGTRDILQARSGAIAAEDNVEEFARALSRVAADAELREKMRMQGRSWAMEWSDVALTRRLGDLYRQLQSRAVIAAASMSSASIRERCL